MANLSADTGAMHTPRRIWSLPRFRRVPDFRVAPRERFRRRSRSDDLVRSAGYPTKGSDERE